MLDVGWSEMLLIVVVAVLVIGPQDIPKAMLAAGRVMRRIQYVKFALSRQFEDLMKDADIDELRKANFERARDLPDIDESAGDLESYNDALMKPAPSAAHDPADTAGPPEGRDD